MSKWQIIGGPKMYDLMTELFSVELRKAMSGEGIQSQIENHKDYSLKDFPPMVSSDSPQKPKLVGKLPMSDLYYDASGCFYRVTFSGGKTWYMYMYSSTPIKKTHF